MTYELPRALRHAVDHCGEELQIQRAGNQDADRTVGCAHPVGSYFVAKALGKITQDVQLRKSLPHLPRAQQAGERQRPNLAKWIANRPHTSRLRRPQQRTQYRQEHVRMLVSVEM